MRTNICTTWEVGAHKPKTYANPDAYQVCNVVNLCDLVVVQLEFGQAVQSLQAVNLGDATETKHQAFNFTERDGLFLLRNCICVTP